MGTETAPTDRGGLHPLLWQATARSDQKDSNKNGPILDNLTPQRATADICSVFSNMDFEPGLTGA